jgi:curved DNA-binding protein CbpA
LGVVKAGGLEIPPELQRELQDLASREGRISHYELLGVPADADGGAIRRAFLDKSRTFHPDAWYRKELGEYGPLLSRAFQRINTAYQVLTDAEARSAYDKENLRLFTAADQALIQKRNLSDEEEQRRDREKRERLLRMKGFARIGAARQLFEQAVQQAGEGNRGAAIAALKTARELDPQRREISLKLTELEKEALKVRVASAITWAKDLESQQQFEKAKGIFLNAFNQDGASAEAALGAARCAAEARDWQQCASWAQRAIELGPAELAAHVLAARAFAQLKLKARAKAELQFVLAKKPDHPEAKALLKGL